jgi:hypothetical protein
LLGRSAVSGEVSRLRRDEEAHIEHVDRSAVSSSRHRSLFLLSLPKTLSPRLSGRHERCPYPTDHFDAAIEITAAPARDGEALHAHLPGYLVGLLSAACCSASDPLLRYGREQVVDGLDATWGRPKR